VPPEGIAGLVKELPDYAPFGYSGMAACNGKLYASSNVGLLEFENGNVSKAYRVQGKYSVVSGPWCDEAHHLLWMQDNQRNDFLNFNGSGWVEVSMPQPPKEYFTRGDIAEGFRGSGNSHGFWLEGGGGVWRWDNEKRQWKPERMPRMDYPNRVIRVLALESRLMLVARHEGMSLLFRRGQQFSSDTVHYFDDGWREVPNHSGMNYLLKGSVTVGDTGYICTEQGNLLAVNLAEVKSVKAPGSCEALAKASSNRLLVSFTGDGVYEYADKWILRAKSPYPSSEGEHWAYLAEQGSQIAYATSSVPHLDKAKSSDTDIKWTRSGTTAMWLSEGQGFRPVVLDR